MLNLISKIQKAIERHHKKLAKANATNEIASAYLNRIANGRTIPRVTVQKVYDNGLGQFRKAKN